jgi:hypothetical protein
MKSYQPPDPRSHAVAVSDSLSEARSSEAETRPRAEVFSSKAKVSREWSRRSMQLLEITADRLGISRS